MSDEQVSDVGVAGDEGEKELRPAGQLELIRGGEPTGERFPVSARTVVGRFDPAVGPIDVDLGPLPEGVYVSRKHAEVYFEDGKWFVRDLGSSNGTFVLADSGDFERIADSVELHDGQQVAFGNARFIFSASSEGLEGGAQQETGEADADVVETGDPEM